MCVCGGGGVAPALVNYGLSKIKVLRKIPFRYVLYSSRLPKCCNWTPEIICVGMVFNEHVDPFPVMRCVVAP